MRDFAVSTTASGPMWLVIVIGSAPLWLLALVYGALAVHRAARRARLAREQRRFLATTRAATEGETHA